MLIQFLKQGGCSDHLRCKIQLFPPEEKLRKPFKYVNAIGRLEGFLPLVRVLGSNPDTISLDLCYV